MVVGKNENNIPRTSPGTAAKPLQAAHALSRGNRAAHGTQNYGSPIHGFSFRASIKTLPVADGIRMPSRRAAVGAISRLRMAPSLEPGLIPAPQAMKMAFMPASVLR